jgi:hypothetical protein
MNEHYIHAGLLRGPESFFFWILKKKVTFSRVIVILARKFTLRKIDFKVLALG